MRSEQRGPRRPILRYYVPAEQRDEHLRELIETCRQVGAREVLLFSSPAYSPEAIFIGEEALKVRMEHLHTCARRIREAGLIFSLNVFVTLGHIHVPQHEVERFGFRRQIDADGRPAAHPVLDPSCPRLREYQSRFYEAYADLEPRLMYVDDDFGVRLGNCFHADRLQRFAELFGCNPDRDVVKSLMFSVNRATVIGARRLMRTLVTGDLREMADILRQAAHRRDTRIRLGLMYPGSVFFDVAAVAQALAGQYRPSVRPQIPQYREDRPVAEYAETFWQLDYWRAKLPQGFEFHPECENFPYTELQKSPAASYAHTAYCYGCGEPEVAMSLNSFSSGIPAGESRQIVRFTAARKTQLEAVGKLLAGGSHPAGVGLWEAGASRMMELLPRMSVSSPQLLGFPLYSAIQPEQATIHWGPDLRDVSEEQLQLVVARGGVLDLEGAQALADRGYLERTGLVVGEACASGAVLSVDLERRDGSIEQWPIFYFIRNVSREAMPRAARASRARVLSSYRDDHGRSSVPFAMTWEGPDGQPFALLNACVRLWPRFTLTNPWMADVLAETLRWVQGRRVLVRVVQGANVLIKARWLPAPERLLLTLINFSTASHDAIELALSEEAADLSYTEIQANGSVQPVSPRTSGKVSLLQLPGATPCLGVRFVVGG